MLGYRLAWSGPQRRPKAAEVEVGQTYSWSIFRDRIGDPRFWYQGFFARNFLDFFEIFRVIFWIFLASPGPGVAGNGFSAKNHSQFRGRDANPCPGDPFRGDFPFLEQKKLGTKVFGVFIPWAPPRAQNTKNLGLGPWFCAETGLAII